METTQVAIAITKRDFHGYHYIWIFYCKGDGQKEVRIKGKGHKFINQLNKNQY